MTAASDRNCDTAAFVKLVRDDDSDDYTIMLALKLMGNRLNQIKELLAVFTDNVAVGE